MTEVEVDTVDEDCSKFLIWEFGCEFKAAETFTCGSYFLGATDGKMKTRQTNDCRTRDYGHEKLKQVREELETGAEQVTVEMAGDGTNDEVHLEICSDVNDACCDTCMDSIANDFQSWSI